MVVFRELESAKEKPVEARPLSVREIFGYDERLVVPIFQRRYVWSEDRNWAPLWQDLMSLVDRYIDDDNISSHFLGAVVLDHLRTPTGSLPARQVIDGQQRLTTLQILLAAVRDSYRAAGLPARYVNTLHKLTINQDEMSEDPRTLYKVWPTLADRGVFSSIIDIASDDAAETVLASADMSPIINAYRYFYTQVTTWLTGFADAEEQTATAEALVRILQSKLEIVVIDLGPNDNAQVIFESLNDRGTPLLPSDLIKNLIFQMSEELGLDSEALYEKYWRQLEAPRWQREITIGRTKRSALDLFFTHFLTMRLQHEVLSPVLFTEFRSYLVGTGPEKLEETMREIDRYAAIYDRIAGCVGESDHETRFLERLAAMDSSTVTPLILYLFGVHDVTTRAPALDAIESWFVRRMLCRLTAKNYNRFLLGMLAKLTASTDPGQTITDLMLGQDAVTSFWPTDDDIRGICLTQPLYQQLTQKRLRIVLEGCDSQSENGYGEVMRISGPLPIEHLMPQKWETHWPILTDSAESRAAETARRERLVHTIGNLALITTKLNSKLSNSSWPTKRAEILSHSALALNRSLSTEWGPDEILARSSQLADAICREWARPQNGVKTPPVMGGITSVSELRFDEIESADSIDTDDTWPVENSEKGSRSGRKMATHIIEVFERYPMGTVLTVAQLRAHASSQYVAGEASSGAISKRLEANNVEGISRVEGVSPLCAQKVSSEGLGM